MEALIQEHGAVRLLHDAMLFERLSARLRHVLTERVAVEGDCISYAPDDSGNVGMYIAGKHLSPEHNYFEVEITDTGVTGSIVVGLVSSKHTLNQHPGFLPNSIGYHTGDGRLFRDAPKGADFGPKFEIGTRIGCGIRFDIASTQENGQSVLTAFFTKNGREISTCYCTRPSGGLFPAIGFHSEGAEVRLFLDKRWIPEDMRMCIDSSDDEWARLHDIKLDSTILEYVGRGKSIIDIGLAQAKYPLDPTHHYFEIEIVDPGENCYIAIGLARKDYPKFRHPGWNRGSIAYHADDGKIFVGSGVGEPFGPRCHKGDVMGCGIIFPRDSLHDFECSSGNNSPPSGDLDDDASFGSESEDEEWWKKRDNIENGDTVQVFFTRNGKTIGYKDVCIPKGGFFPTIGMLSSDEKVKVDLHPLTG